MPTETDQYSKAALFLSNAVRQRGFSSVLFASASREEGTSTCVLHVARQLKETYGLNPLVVEVRPRKAGLRSFFDLGKRRVREPVGVTKLTTDEFMQLGSGRPVVLTREAPEERKKGGLASVLAGIVQDAESEFDLVLIDVPPLLEHADGIEAGSLVPRMFLLVEAGRTRYEMLERVKRELADADIEILGVILNKHRRFIPGWIYRYFMH